MSQHVIRIMALFALVALFSAPQVFATGNYHPPSCVDCKKTDLPDCYWTVTFKVKYNDKYHYGKIFYSDDNLTGSGTEKLAIKPSSYLGSKSGLLGVEFNFYGKTYDQCDDIDYSKYPIIKFYNGQFKGLDFLFKAYDNKYHIDYDDFEKNGNDKGYVKYYQPEYKCEVIPTPAAASSGLALLAALGFRRRRAA